MKFSLLLICSISFLAFVPNQSYAFLSETAVLISIAGNTSSQLERLGKLMDISKESLGYAKKMKEATDEVRDAYDTLDDVQSNLQALAELRNSNMEGLEDLNDAIESVQDKKERFADLLKKANEAQRNSKAVEIATEESRSDLNKEIRTNQKQISKSFGYGARKNQEQVTAQNTGLISNKLTVTNSILKKQAQDSAKINQIIVADIVSREREQQEQESFLTLGKKGRN